MQDGRKAVWSIPYVSVAFFLSLKQNFIAYCSSKVVVFKVGSTPPAPMGRYELLEGRWPVNSRMGALKLSRVRWSNYSKMWRWCW